METYTNIELVIKITCDKVDGEDLAEAKSSLIDAIDSIFPDSWTIEEVTE